MKINLRLRDPNISCLTVSSRMRGSVSFLLAAIALFTVSAALAGPREHLFQDKRVCDVNNVLCFRGTMTYYSNPRLLRLRARVKTASGPGLLRIRLTGTNELGHRRYSPFELRVRGRHSEIINHKMIPDHPDVLAWEVDLVEFIAEGAR